MLKVKASTKSISELKDDYLVVCLFEPKSKKGKISVPAGLKKTAAHIAKAEQRGEFNAKFKQMLSLPYPKGLNVKRLLLVGLGKKTDSNLLRLQQALGGAASVLKNHVGDSASIALSGLKTANADAASVARAAVEAVALSIYEDNRFCSEAKDKGKSAGEKKKKQLNKLTLLSEANDLARAKKGVREGLAICEGVYLVRNLVNAPANHLYPSDFAAAVKKVGEEQSLKVKVLSEAVIKKEKMGAFLSVSMGSEQKPTFSIIEYNADKKDLPLIALVGKGITFDTGGISIKPSGNMHEMKTDMAGAATVLGTMAAAASLKLPLRLVGVMPACENMPSGRATRPGDVVTSYKGLTIEVQNTDAEGRMILADALAYTVKNFKPDKMINLATLTGAAVVAFGLECCAVMGNNDLLAQKIVAAGAAVGEPTWQMPMFDFYADGLKSTVADVRNIGRPREAGTIVAGKFLEKFVGDETDWCHIDIAGPAYVPRNKPLYPSGASGFGVRLLINLLEGIGSEKVKKATAKSAKKK
jgi:leucyl aminopeptidase